MRDTLAALLRILNEKGSRFAALLQPGFSEEEIDALQTSAGFVFPDELRDYLSVFGRKPRLNSEVERNVDAEIMPGFVCLSYEVANELVRLLHNSGVLGEDLAAKRPDLKAFPVLTSGTEYISVIWANDVYFVAWKIKAYGYESWQWPSLQKLFEYITECWKTGCYQIDELGDELLWNVEGSMQLLEKFGGRVGNGSDNT